MITGPLQDHKEQKIRTEAHEKFKPQISNITVHITEIYFESTYRSQENDPFDTTFLHSFSLIIKHFILLQLAKNSLTCMRKLSGHQNCLLYCYESKFVTNQISLRWIKTFGTFILILFAYHRISENIKHRVHVMPSIIT